MTTGTTLSDTPAPAPQGPAADPRLKRWKRAFYASLAVNLLILGVVGGAILKGPPPKHAMADPGFGPYGEALAESDRKALKRAFRSRETGVRELRATMVRDRQAVLVALRAEPFDAAALDAALVAQRNTISSQIDFGQKILRDRLVEMTVPERRAFADRLEAAMDHRPRRHDDAGRGRD